MLTEKLCLGMSGMGLVAFAVLWILTVHQEISGWSKPAPTKEEILQDIVKMFNLQLSPQ